MVALIQKLKLMAVTLARGNELTGHL